VKESKETLRENKRFVCVLWASVRVGGVCMSLCVCVCVCDCMRVGVSVFEQYTYIHTNLSLRIRFEFRLTNIPFSHLI